MNDIELLQLYVHDAVYTLIYLFPAESLMAECGVDGEAAAREGVRRFGRDRGLTNRNKHLKLGLKLNMRNYFTYTRDLPPNPHFQRDRLALTPQERISHTLQCPVATLCDRYNLRKIGRIFCEEFHQAAFSTYAYGYTQVNLARTLTQDGDTYCSFSVLLRPENLPDDLKPVCFEEYDPGYVFPEFTNPVPTAKGGYNSLSLRMYYHLLDAAREYLGETGVNALLRGVGRLVEELAEMMRHSAKEQNATIDRKFAEDNQPFELDTAREPMWETYAKYDARALFQTHYCDALLRRLNIDL